MSVESMIFADLSVTLVNLSLRVVLDRKIVTWQAWPCVVCSLPMIRDIDDHQWLLNE